jgi:hypothetical protein
MTSLSSRLVCRTTANALVGALILVSALGAKADQPLWVDAKLSTTAQFFRQALLPGQPGVVSRLEPAFPVTVSGFTRFGADAFSGELALWGSVGPRDGTSVDGDITSAWGQFRTSRVRVKLGRQVTLPGASRYVRFDGASAGVTFGVFDLDGYVGWVALPRWNQPRGAQYLGFLGADVVKDPLLQEAQNRVGQVTAGARATVRLPLEGIVGVAFHEQHDDVGAAFRLISADGVVRPWWWLSLGARGTLDLRTASFAEARVWLDVSRLPRVPLSIDYVFQKPSLLLPQTSIFSVFGSASWHELGAESTVRALESLDVTVRAAGQLYEGDRPGARALLGFRWRPGLEGRWLVLGEAGRVFTAEAGALHFRAGARWRMTESFSAALDAAQYFYDVPVNGVAHSTTAVASVEWRAKSWLRASASATVMQTPWAVFEAQGMVRVVAEVGSAGGGW